jgi:hypothetical protein
MIGTAHWVYFNRFHNRWTAQATRLFFCVREYHRQRAGHPSEFKQMNDEFEALEKPKTLEQIEAEAAKLTTQVLV